MDDNIKNEVEASVSRHLSEALRGAIAESEGDILLSRRLNAETKLCLIRMSDEELWELAKRTSSHPEHSVESAYKSYKQKIKELEDKADEWMKDLKYIPVIRSRE